MFLECIIRDGFYGKRENNWWMFQTDKIIMLVERGMLPGICAYRIHEIGCE